MFSVSFWILVVIVCFGVRHLALHLPIPPEMVRRYREEQATHHRAALASVATEAASTDDERPRRRYDDGDADELSSDPSFNIDGTLMLGDWDVNGNPFGITDD